MNRILSRLGREPVLIGAAVLQLVDAWMPDELLEDPSPTNVRLKLLKVAFAGIVALVVRAFSSPKVAVEEAKVVGYDEAVADVSALQPRIAPPPIPPVG